MRPDPATIWKRRVLLMAVVALVVAIPATLLIRGGEDDGGTPERVERAAQTTPPVPRKVDRKLDVAMQLPRGWRSKRRDGVLTLRSKRRDAAVVISAPGPAKSAGEIYEQAVDAVRAQYRKAKVLDESTGRLGGRQARTTALAVARPDDGGRMGVLVAVARGKKRAYLVEVFSRASDPGIALLEAQTVLSTLEIEP